MKSWIAIALVFAFTQAQAGTLRNLCSKIINTFHVVSEAVHGPVTLITSSGDVVLDVHEDAGKKYRSVTLGRLITNNETMDLVRENLWVTRHWKFLWLFPNVTWKISSEQRYMVVGRGTFPLGEVDINLPRTGIIQIRISRFKSVATERLEKAIKDATDEVKADHPTFQISTFVEDSNHYIELKTASGYQPNNSFVHKFMEHALTILAKGNGTNL